jgi:hypothetical protein
MLLQQILSIEGKRISRYIRVSSCASRARLTLLAPDLRPYHPLPINNGRRLLRIAALAVSVAGIGVFSFPHPLHNVFGISELIGYQAPIAFAYAWRRDSRASALATFSWIMSGVVWITIFLNLTTLHRYGLIWEHVRQTYGLVQRCFSARGSAGSPAWGCCSITGSIRQGSWRSQTN